MLERAGRNGPTGRRFRAEVGAGGSETKQKMLFGRPVPSRGPRQEADGT